MWAIFYATAILTLDLGREVLTAIKGIHNYPGEAACWAITLTHGLKLRKIRVKDLYKTY